MCVAVGAAGHQSRKQEKGMKPGRAETTLQKQPKGKALDMKKKKISNGKSLQGAGETQEKGKRKLICHRAALPGYNRKGHLSLQLFITHHAR